MIFFFVGLAVGLLLAGVLAVTAFVKFVKGFHL